MAEKWNYIREVRKNWSRNSRVRIINALRDIYEHRGDYNDEYVTWTVEYAARLHNLFYDNPDEVARRIADVHKEAIDGIYTRIKKFNGVPVLPIQNAPRPKVPKLFNHPQTVVPSDGPSNLELLARLAPETAETVKAATDAAGAGLDIMSRITNAASRFTSSSAPPAPEEILETIRVNARIETLQTSSVYDDFMSRLYGLVSDSSHVPGVDLEDSVYFGHVQLAWDDMRTANPDIPSASEIARSVDNKLFKYLYKLAAAYVRNNRTDGPEYARGWMSMTQRFRHTDAQFREALLLARTAAQYY